MCVPRKYTGLNGKSSDVLRAAKLYEIQQSRSEFKAGEAYSNHV